VGQIKETGQRQTGSPNSKSASYRPSAHRAYDALTVNDAHGVKQRCRGRFAVEGMLRSTHTEHEHLKSGGAGRPNCHRADMLVRLEHAA
jgi:hypothetical protein